MQNCPLIWLKKTSLYHNSLLAQLNFHKLAVAKSIFFVKSQQTVWVQRNHHFIIFFFYFESWIKPGTFWAKIKLTFSSFSSLTDWNWNYCDFTKKKGDRWLFLFFWAFEVWRHEVQSEESRSSLKKILGGFEYSVV